MGALSVGAFMYQGPTGTLSPIVAGLEMAKGFFGEGRSGGLGSGIATRGHDEGSGPAPRASRGSYWAMGLGSLDVAFPGSVAGLNHDSFLGGHGFGLPGGHSGAPWQQGFSGKNWISPTYPGGSSRGVGGFGGGSGGGSGGLGGTVVAPWHPEIQTPPPVSLVELPWVVQPGDGDDNGLISNPDDQKGGDAPVHAPEPSSLLLCGTALAVFTRRMIKKRSVR